MVTLPYQTTVGRTFKTEEYIREIKRAEINLALPPVMTVGGETLLDSALVTPRPEHDDIPNFGHIFNLGTEGNPVLVLDGRQYMRFNERAGTVQIVQANDWQQQCVRLALTNTLLSEGPRAMARMTDYPVKVFIDWITSTLVSRYGLNAQTMMAMRVITALYYQAMLLPELRTKSDARMADVGIVSKLAGATPEFVAQLLDPNSDYAVGDLKDGNDLAIALAQKTFTVSLGQFKFADLHQMLKPTWFGNNAQEMVGMALEHLPTWLAIVFTAITDRTYKKSKITERAERVGSANDQRAYVNIVTRAVMDQTTRR